MSQPDSHLVLVGGGHSHALLLLGLARDPIPQLRITLVSDVESAPYSGMLPGHVAGVYDHDEMHIDLPRLCERAGAVFVRAAVGRVDGASREIYDEEGCSLGLRGDFLSLNVGSAPDLSRVSGADKFAIPSKPVPKLLEGWETIRKAAVGDVVLVGGGAGGIELALAMRSQLPAERKVTLVHSGAALWSARGGKVAQIAAEQLARAGVSLILDERVTEVKRGSLILEGKGEYPADSVIWVTSPAAPDWLMRSDLPLTDDGFIRVKATLQSVAFPEVFAAGDVATIEEESLPKSGVYAVRMAKPLEANLRAMLAGESLEDYSPQREVLAIIGTADGKALASKGRFTHRSSLMWWWKDRIDRQFMEQFL